MFKLAALLLWPICIWGALPEELTCIRQIEAALLIQDVRFASKKAKEALKLYPASPVLQRLLVQACARAGEEREMLQAFRRMTAPFGCREEAMELSEEMGWGILANGGKGRALVLRAYSLIGAALTHDAKALPYLQVCLNDSSAILRQVAVKLSAAYGDAPLQAEIMRMLDEEQVFPVRLAAIEAAGGMHMRGAAAKLSEILSSDRSLLEEKWVAATAMSVISDDVTDEELLRLAYSDRAGLRMLCCQLMRAFDKLSSTSLLPRLLDDVRAEVRAAAALSCALMDVRPFSAEIASSLRILIEDPDPLASITASWCLMRSGEPCGAEKLMQKLSESHDSVACIAAAALASGGTQGLPYLKAAFQQAHDVWIKGNLAVGLIGLRSQLPEAMGALQQVLKQDTLLMWTDVGAFHVLAKSRLRHVSELPSHPEAVDLLARLNLLHRLITLHFPGAKEEVRHFLQQRPFGIGGMAASLLLEEGDDSDAEVLRQILDDPHEASSTRLQAALVLASWIREPQAIQTLQRMYFEVDTETKVKILEALGAVGDKDCGDFLIDRLDEPFQTLRVVAASSLIRSLNR